MVWLHEMHSTWCHVCIQRILYSHYLICTHFLLYPIEYTHIFLVLLFCYTLASTKSTLVQVMALCCQATSHYLIQCWPITLMPYGVFRPQETSHYLDQCWPILMMPCGVTRPQLVNQNNAAALHQYIAIQPCPIVVWLYEVHSTWSHVCIQRILYSHYQLYTLHPIEYIVLSLLEMPYLIEVPHE